MKPTEGELPAALQQAQSIVAEQLRQLRAVADTVRTRQAALAVEARAAERALDEATTQLLFAANHNQGKAGLLGRKEAQLRERYEVITREVEANERALRELAQLVGQIEMSSAGLHGGHESTSTDPWVQALRAQVIHGREEERLRLAREVHDGPAQVLANTLMGLAVCEGLAPPGNTKLEGALKRLHTATQEGLREVRRFIADLRPAQVAERGLGAAIHEYVRGYQNAYGTQVVIEADPLPRLAPEAEIVIYRIVQEALQNAHKHARGARVVIRLTYSANQLRLTVRDDGPGFDPRNVARRTGRESWGLMSMRERAELVGAQLAVASRPGYGTEISLTLSVQS